MDEWTTYWWEVTDEESDLAGEEFFTELKTGDKEEHRKYAESIFPNTELHCWGKISEYEAESMGLDTY